MERLDLDDCVRLGYDTAKAIALEVNAANAREYAAKRVASCLTTAKGLMGNGYNTGLVPLQKQSRRDLTALLAFSEKDLPAAIAAFVGGAYQFAEEEDAEEE